MYNLSVRITLSRFGIDYGFHSSLVKSNPWHTECRGGSRTAATSKMELFVVIVNGWKPLTIITKSSILDVTGVLDPPPLT